MPETSGIHDHSPPQEVNRPGGSLTILITPWTPDCSGVPDRPLDPQVRILVILTESLSVPIRKASVGFLGYSLRSCLRNADLRY